MYNLPLIFIAGIVLLTGCNGTSPSPSQILMGEGIATSDDLSVTSGNVVLKEDQPGIAFAFAMKPDHPREFTYFVIFNHHFGNGVVNVTSVGNSDGSTAHTSHTITAFGTDCKVEYRVVLNADKKTVETETTLIADAPYDPSNGKLYLIDTETTPPTVTQLNLNLPTLIPNLDETNSVVEFSHDTLSGLRKADKTIDEFCRRIETKGN